MMISELWYQLQNSGISFYPLLCLFVNSLITALETILIWLGMELGTFIYRLADITQCKLFGFSMSTGQNYKHSTFVQSERISALRTCTGNNW